MKRLFFILCLAFLYVGIYSQNHSNINQNKVKYYGRSYFLTEGTAIPDSEKESPYDRLPASYKNRVREAVWSLSKNSAGISIRFLTNSTSVSVKYELLNNATMNHMAETGIKGIDLYFLSENGWQYVNTARPTGKTNEVTLINNMFPVQREFKMYLPLYDGVTKLEVGVDSLSKISKPEKNRHKPVIFYGTSITQGGCASRPGMAHTNIISRKLGTDCINLGFSGNGRMEKPVAELISGIDALFYVIECTENMTPEEINSNEIPLVETIRKKRPSTPIILVNCMTYERSYLDTKNLESLKLTNDMCDKVFREMTKKGIKKIYFIDKEGSIGNDHEGTVDGTHYTDLGFMRYADFLIAKFKQLNLPLN